MASVALVWLGQPISGLLGLEHSVHDLRLVSYAWLICAVMAARWS